MSTPLEAAPSSESEFDPTQPLFSQILRITQEAVAPELIEARQEYADNGADAPIIYIQI